MPKDFRDMERSNRSANPYIRRLSSPARRTFVRGSMAAAVSGVLAPLLASCAGAGGAAGGPRGRQVVVREQGQLAQLQVGRGLRAGLRERPDRDCVRHDQTDHESRQQESDPAHQSKRKEDLRRSD